MKRLLFILSLVFMCYAVNANAALELRGTDSLGYRLIYDTDLDITWYDYSNPAALWSEQTSWGSSLTVNFGGTIYDDWRLPWTDGCQTYYCTGSEMGHLYYTELGNEADSTFPYEGFQNTGDFQNITSGRYVAQNSPNGADPWRFSFSMGLQIHGDAIEDRLAAIAVRDGDVPQLAVVPEPISSILFITGGALLASKRFIRRKRLHKTDTYIQSGR